MNSSDKKKIKLTHAQCIVFAKSFQPGDTFVVSSNDLTGQLVKFGTGNDDGYDANHTGIYKGEGIGRTIEADGKAVANHLISDYFPKLMSGDCRIKVFRIKGLTVEELEAINEVIKKQLNKPYSQWINFWFGVWGLTNKVLPPLGWLMGLVRNPGVSRDKAGALKNYVCSIAAAEAWLAVARAKKHLMDKALENRTPENWYNSLNACPVAILAADSLAVAREKEKTNG